MTTVEVKTLAVTTLVGIAHIVCGIAVLVDPVALNVTPLAALASMNNPVLAGWGLIVVGVMAVVACNMTFVVNVLMLLPQQALLILQVLSISKVLITGQYPDGYLPSGGSWFILTDQIWPWLLTVTHTGFLAAFIYQGVRGGGGDS
jgi:hypothetical protein